MAAIYKEYSEALFILARENDECKEILGELENAERIFEENPEYMEFLSCPSIPNGERTDALCEAFGSMSEHALSFLCILCERGRIRDFSDCVKEYKRLYDALANVKTAIVYTPVLLTEEQKSALARKLEAKYGCSVSLDCRVDDTLLGGAVVELDGKIIDGSVKSQLHQLKDVIIK